MTRAMRIARVACLVMVIPFLGEAQDQTESLFSLEDVLDRMERAGLELETLEATLDQTSTTSFTGTETRQSGKIYFSTEGGESRIRVSITEPGSREVVVGGGQARSYAPGVNQLTVFDLGERQNAAEYFMLGFGPANSRLREDYDVSLVGRETLDGIPTSVLDLRPRSERVAGMFPTIRLWIGQGRWMPVQSRINEPNGNHQVIEYSDVKTNESIPASTFELEVPSDAQIIRM